ncbi:MAG: hypothetical protein KDA61_06915 [Planctomycetales bacterium]|nr:hypothetical protein [Planctomycetales bacterium]
MTSTARKPHVAAEWKRALEATSHRNAWTYRPDGVHAAEPAALTALALVAHGQWEAARPAVRWLAELQQPTGAVGIAPEQDQPHWPTGLALLAWARWNAARDAAQSHATGSHASNDQTAAALVRAQAAAIDWALRDQGKTSPRRPQIGHDTTLVGWAWAEGTHSWLEPTCYFVLALEAAGLSSHPRVAMGRRMIVDRLLPTGGANYGNTFVMGQQLLPHVQPTALALLAIAGDGSRVADHMASDDRIAKSLAWLETHVDRRTPSASLSYAILGLAAWKRRPTHADDWLSERLSPPNLNTLSDHHRALLLWAAAPENLRS